MANENKLFLFKIKQKAKKKKKKKVFPSDVERAADRVKALPLL